MTKKIVCCVVYKDTIKGQKPTLETSPSVLGSIPSIARHATINTTNIVNTE